MSDSTMPRRIVRFSLDLDVNQRNFIRMFALRNEISASIVMRALIHELESDPDFANKVIDVIYSVPDVEPDYDDDDAA